MTLEIFISILVISAGATSIAIEILKTLLNKANINYKTMPLAAIVAFIIGVVEVLIYSSSTNMSPITIVYSLCMGVSNAVASNVGYDKVKELIYALFGKTK
jgi:Co/Zn/Cd efflux system component